MSALFEHEARRDGKIVAILRAMPDVDGIVVVETEVFPLGKGAGDGIVRPFTFATRSHAARFTDEALLCLQYLDCDVTE